MNDKEKADAEDRYDSQRRYVGEVGQAKIETVKVAIVGLSGTGSHVAQQLAYLGVRDFVIVDPEVIELRNLNRVVGATESDVNRRKTEVAIRVILSVQPNAKIVAHALPIASHAVQDLKDRDVIIGCVDHDAARFVMIEASCQYSIPYLDVATEIHEDSQPGGHVIFTGLGKGCLMCRELIDQDELQESAETDEQKRERQKIYGVDASALGASGPSVVMLNGLLASAAVMEFVAYVTGLREPNAALYFRGAFSTFTKDNNHAPNNCYFCEHVYKNAGTIDLSRYSLREPIVSNDSTA